MSEMMNDCALYVLCISVSLSVLSGLLRYSVHVTESSRVIQNIDQRVHFIEKDSPKVRKTLSRAYFIKQTTHMFTV